MAQHGEIIENVIYVRDVAQGLVRACFARGLQHRVFNIGTGKGITLVDMAQAVKKVYPDALIEIGPGLNYMGWPEPYYSVFDISRARKDPGYEPRYGIEGGVGLHRDHEATEHTAAICALSQL